jgi:hypothetical protein
MKAIVSRTVNGTFPEVGTSDRMLVSDLKTEQGVIKRARHYAQGKTFRVEFFHSDNLYGQPYRVIVVVR